MRLIDADLLKECYAGTNALDGKADYMSIRKMIDNQPTVYDVSKVVAELEERSKEYNSGVRLHGKPEEMLTHEAIDIVKRGGIYE